MRRLMWLAVMSLVGGGGAWGGAWGGVGMALAQTAGPAVLSGPAVVEDGDTVQIGGQRIHFDGADAPELGQTCKMPDRRIKCGEEARDYLVSLIRGRPVDCRVKARDVFDRIVASCFVAGQDLQRDMIRAGWAVAFANGGRQYRDDNNDARTSQRGIWESEFVLPSEWRRSFRVQEVTFGGQGRCFIKGNIDANGRRHYYKPYERWYDRTRIDAAKGERWFCSEQEALDAGWQPAGN